MDIPLLLHIVPARVEAFILSWIELFHIVYVEGYGIYCQPSCHSCCFVAIILTL